MKLKIGYKVYSFLLVKRIDKKKSLGSCYLPSNHRHAKGHIRVVKGLSPVEQANTTLHEIMHAIAYDKGLELPNKLEERIVCAFANGLIGFARDNPRFFMRLVRAAIRAS